MLKDLRKSRTSVGSERNDMKAAASLFAFFGLLVGFGSFAFTGVAATHVAVFGLALIAFGIFLHVDRKA